MHAPTLVFRHHGDRRGHRYLALRTQTSLHVVAKDIRGNAPKAAAAGGVKVSLDLRLRHREGGVATHFKRGLRDEHGVTRCFKPAHRGGYGWS